LQLERASLLAMTGLRTRIVLIVLASLTHGCGDVRPTLQAHGSDGLIGATEMSAPSDPPFAAGEQVARVPPQDTGFLVFGLVRPDGVVMPRLLRAAGRWAEVTYFDIGPPVPEPGTWAQATSYYVRDTLGVKSTLEAIRPVRICCGGEGNDVWAHSTDRSGEDVESFRFPVIGYGFSSAIA